MAKTWLSITVELLGGGHEPDLWPRPGRVLVVGPQHTFADLATAIDHAFARWDRSHLFEFTLPDGGRVAVPDLEWDDGEPVLDATGTKVARSVPLGSAFRYVFDLGDFWVHRCTVGPRKVDALVALGIVPDRPLPSFGWGTIPDQYGRRWHGDDGESPEPPRPADSDPMIAFGWPDKEPDGTPDEAPRLRASDLPDLRGATVRSDRDAVRGLRPGALRDRLLDALQGRGAFGRFSRALGDEPEVRAEWHAFCDERERGRARALLVEEGYLPLPS